MKFLKRIKYFGVGFGFGLIFVFFLFKDRDFRWAWLPGNRVTNFIINHPIKIDSLKDKSFTNLSNLTNDLYSTILNGKVNFSRSQTKNNLKYYVIEDLHNTICVSVSFEDSISQIIKFNKTIFSKEKLIDKKAPNLNMDDKTFLEQINKKEKKLSALFLCQLEKLNITKKIFELSLNSVKINWNSSKPFIKPYGFIIGEILINSNYYSILLEKSSEKIRFKNIKKNYKGSKVVNNINDFNEDCK
tara:strand:- start:18261 stop:18992 length:732 start_codon:yes stop_codon:yes gene_type:complete